MNDDPHGATWSLYRRLLSFAKPYTTRLTIGIVAGLVGGGSLVGLLQLSPELLRPFSPTAGAAVEVQEPVDAEPSGGLYDLGRVERFAARYGVSVYHEDGRLTWQALVIALALLPVFVLLKSLGNYVNRYMMRWVGARIVRDLRDTLFSNLQRQSLKFFGKTDVGRLISRCTNDTTVVETVIASTAADVTRAPIEIVASLGFVVVFSVRHGMLDLVGMMLVVFPLCIVPVVVLGNVVRRYTRRAFGRIADLVSRMHENFTGVRVVKAYDMEHAEIQRFKEMDANYFRSVVGALRAELLMTPMMEGVAVLMACAFLVICYARGVEIWQIIPVALAGVVVYRPLKQLARINSNLQRGAAALERIYAVLDANTVVPESPNPIRVEGLRDRIRFENVSFSYDDKSESAFLRDISIDIPRGSIVALVGETGSGKSTLANLLARFYDPTAGRITLDGIDLREIETTALRKLMGIVTQETILFNDTIAANIAYGAGAIDEASIIEAAKKANAHEFIQADPAGYSRVVGEKGFVLSGGERQRVALARAILKNPPLLILDEATSALDTVTENLVQQAIARVMKDRTVFAIAHRLSTVRHADQILLVGDGRIVERGTHEELYAADGGYRKLCDMQILDA